MTTTPDRAENPAARRHLDTVEHEGETQSEHDPLPHWPPHEAGDMVRKTGGAEHDPDEPAREPRGIDDVRVGKRHALRRIGGGHCADGLHRLHRKGRAIEQSGRDHCHAEPEQHAIWVDVGERDVRHQKWHQGAEIAEGAGTLHHAEAHAAGSDRPWVGTLQPLRRPVDDLSDLHWDP